MHPAFPSNIRIGSIGMPVTSTLTYLTSFKLIAKRILNTKPACVEIAASLLEVNLSQSYLKTSEQIYSLFVVS
jgi:hypothetical protein